MNKTTNKDIWTKMITYSYIQEHGVGTNNVIIKLVDDKNQVTIEKFDGSIELIAEDIDAVSLYGVPFQPVTEISGVSMVHAPYFIVIISEGVLHTQDYIFYEIEDTEQIGKNLKLYMIMT